MQLFNLGRSSFLRNLLHKLLRYMLDDSAKYAYIREMRLTFSLDTAHKFPSILNEINVDI